MSGPPLSSTPRTRLRRAKEKGRTEREELFAVLRAGLVAHLGVTLDGHPMVVPTLYGFDDEWLYLHGSVASRSLRTDAEVCVTVTLLDSLVLARSVFEHSINYRCAIMYGLPRRLTGAEKRYGLRLMTEHVAPGQWDYARQPSRKELAATTMLALPLTEASVKVRSGPPSDGASADAELDVWAGELPLTSRWQSPVPDPAGRGTMPGVPRHIEAMVGQLLGSPCSPMRRD